MFLVGLVRGFGRRGYLGIGLATGRRGGGALFPALLARVVEAWPFRGRLLVGRRREVGVAAGCAEDGERARGGQELGERGHGGELD